MSSRGPKTKIVGSPRFLGHCEMESASDKLSDENTSHLVMVLNNTTNAISFIGDNISVEAFLKKK